MKKKNILYLYLLPFLLAFAFAESALGQGQGTIVDSLATQKVYHKKPKWYERVKESSISGLGRGDLFDAYESTNPPFLLSPTVPDTLQAAHELIDTIYVHKGSYVTLDLPFHHTEGESSIGSYQRWFNYRTGSTFAKTKNGELLLKPTNKNQKVYQVLNGYIGQPLVSIDRTNTVREMTFYYPNDDELDNSVNNDYHVVACDVSMYKDFRKDYSETNPDSTFTDTWYEPTLSGRMIYIIMPIENQNSWHYIALNKSKTENDFYMEDYEINMPATVLFDRNNDDRGRVALAHEARSYVLPNTIAGKETDLNITLDKNTADIALSTKKLGNASTSRYILFDYPGDADSYGRKSVKKPADGSVPSATILVTKGEYKIARFKINFIERSPLLTQSQLSEDGDGQYAYRKLDYLAENYSLLTTLNFDFNQEVPQYLYNVGSKKDGNEGQLPNKYPFPLSWEESNYAFYDGQKINIATKKYPEFGHYGILHDYVEQVWHKASIPTTPLINSEGKESTFHMYIDAASDPGRIARLQFKERLCRGAELFVSAWVKNANPYGSSGACDPAMLFTLMGVNGEGNSKTYTPIYRFQTGPIPGTYGDTGTTHLPGYTANDWQQVYFTFTNSSEVDYDSYVLEIDNNSNSTKGGDMYLDDVRIYMMSPHARVEQKRYVCEEQALLFLRIGWDRIVSRLGIRDTTSNGKNDSTYVAFAFIDSLTFHQTYNNGKDLTKALEAAKVSTRFFTDTAALGATEPFYRGKVKFSHHFDSNPLYDKTITANAQDPGVGYTGNIAKTFAYTDEAGEKFIALDVDANLNPFRTYYLLLEATNAADGRDWVVFTDLEDVCAVKTTFQVESQNLLLIDGELQSPEAKYCAGKLLKFQPILRAENGDGGLDTIPDARYDWFLGSKEEFLQKWNYNEGVWKESDDVATGVSLHDAIHEFRFNNESITNVDDWHPEGDKAHYPALLKKFGDRWVYNQPFLNTQVSSPSFNLCIHLVFASVKDENAAICAEPLYVTLDVTRESPTAKVGFYDVDYKTPDADPSYKAAIRIGKGEHIAYIDSKKQLCVPLRGIDQNLKLRDSDSCLYLVDSNDPAVRNIIYNKVDFKSTDWPVAQITNFTANKNNTDGSNHIIFYFDDTQAKKEEGYGSVDFREGYWYTLLANFEGESQAVSDGDNSSSATNICYGNLVFDMKVVPEYQKWIGAADGTGNWNNDDNWKRSSADELHKTSDKEYDGTYNYADSTYGFVPMFFTNVTVQEKGKVELYSPNENSTVSGSVHKILDLTNGKPAQIGDATAYIEYDMMVHQATDASGYAYDCIPYYTNTADHIHFEPASEMLHAEKLTYEKAWVDYKLKGARWYTLASPLQAVVAGDWYTLKSGKQTTEYFKDITFSGENNDRQEPSVYQRGWDKSAASMIITLSGSNETAISGNWSGVYNDVTVPYDPGQGFSLKTLNLPAETDSALFRLPKADTEYSYKEAPITNAPVGVTREEGKVGQLMSITSDTTVKLQAAGNSGYYLVGNPFMAHLDAKGFFEENTNLEPKYWLVTDNNQTAAVGTGDDNWTTVDGYPTALIAPLQSFFVQKKSEKGSNDVTFTVDMQTLDSGNTSLLRSTSYTEALTLAVTTADGRESRAAVVYNSMASDDYDSSEDAELFLDSNLGDVPAVYTVAGTMAATINQTSELRDIPIGVYGNSDELVTLTFNGVAKFPGTTLYDAKTQRETALFDGSTLTLTANTHGRYFLRAGTPTANEVVATESIRIYTVSDKLIVTSTEDLQTVAVYDFSGRIVYSMDRLSTHSVNIALPKGNYIVKATGRHEEETRKVLIK